MCMCVWGVRVCMCVLCVHACMGECVCVYMCERVQMRVPSFLPICVLETLRN